VLYNLLLRLRFIGLLWLAASYASAQSTRVAPAQRRPVAEATAVVQEQVEWYDSARQRRIPVVLYRPAAQLRRKPLKPAIINHGYGGHHTDYSFIARFLVARGYLVASIQHELPTDEPLPTTGNPREERRPNWERGVQNIAYVRRELQRRYPGLQLSQLLLVGHSNGGDMAMLFAEQHPRLVRRVVSLDNRRMPLPRSRRPQVLTIRSSDQPADPGVLPSPAEQARYGTRIAKLPHTLHNDMWDGATPAQQQEITELLARFLEK